MGNTTTDDCCLPFLSGRCGFGSKVVGIAYYFFYTLLL